MRRQLLFLGLTLLLANIALGQCDKQLKLKCEKATRMNADGSMGEDQNVHVDIVFSKDSINLAVTMQDGRQMEIHGFIREKDCKMNSAFTEGSMLAKVNGIMLRDGTEKEEKLIFTLEAKNGKFKLFGAKDVSPGTDPEKMYFEIMDQKQN
jgi:hypothetical protein